MFNTAYYDANFMIVEDRGAISCAYLRSWFAIDLLAIIPFDLILKAGYDYNEMVRITRVGRLYKIIKLLKILRALKIVRERNNILSHLNELLSMSAGLQRLLVFCIAFFLISHISCLIFIILA